MARPSFRHRWVKDNEEQWAELDRRISAFDAEFVRLEDVGQKGLRSKLEGLSRAYMRVHRTSPLAFR